MNDTQMLVFRTVAETKNFSKAGTLLHMTQPAVSQHIRALESLYGTRLVERNRRQVQLTEAGRVLYRYACQILDLFDKSKVAVGEAAHLNKIPLVLGATLSIGEYVAPPVIRYFHEQFPEFNLLLRVANTDAVSSMVLEGRLGLGLVEGPINHPQLVQIPFLNDELALIFSPKHPFAQEHQVSLARLLKEPFVAREAGSGTRQVVEDALVAAGHQPSELNIYMVLGSTQAVKGAVEAGHGISIISKWTIQRELAMGTLMTVKVPELSFTRTFRAIHPVRGNLSVPAKEFLNFLRSPALTQILAQRGPRDVASQ